MKIPAMWLALLLLGAGGCYFPQTWTITHLDQANRVGNTQQFYFPPPSFDGVVVDNLPLGAFRATLKPSQQSSFDADLVGFATRFGAGVVANQSRGTFGDAQVIDTPASNAQTVLMHVESITLGHWAPAIAGGGVPTKMTFAIEFRNAAGNTIEIYRHTMEMPFGWSSGERLRNLGEAISFNVGRYIRARRRGLIDDQS